MPKRSFILILTLFAATQAHAFCGFYVAKGDTKIFNRASQVSSFASGSDGHDDGQRLSGQRARLRRRHPCATKIERGQIHVAEKALIDHLDAYSSPRLVEYFDPDPCRCRNCRWKCATRSRSRLR